MSEGAVVKAALAAYDSIQTMAGDRVSNERRARFEAALRARLGADNRADHERWLHEAADLMAFYEREFDDGDATPESIRARYADKPLVGPADLRDAVSWAVSRVCTDKVTLRELRAQLDALSDAKGPKVNAGSS